MVIRSGHVALMGDVRNACKILVGKPALKRSLEDLVVDGMIILKIYSVRM
jgi:hypothetical protein